MSSFPGELPNSRLAVAFSLAAAWHANQSRKSTTIPYISHLMSVSALVMEYGGNVDQAIAALLHDSIEDADSTADAERRRFEIKARFGERVAAIVDGCTDGVPDQAGTKPDWTQRKQAYLQHLMDSPADTLLVSAADKLHNARAILADQRALGDAVFDRFNAGKNKTLWYYEQLAEVFQSRLPGTLSAELTRAVEAMRLAARS